jgi:hypothetical protein
MHIAWKPEINYLDDLNTILVWWNRQKTSVDIKHTKSGHPVTHEQNLSVTNIEFVMRLQQESIKEFTIAWHQGTVSKTLPRVENVKLDMENNTVTAHYAGDGVEQELAFIYSS